MKVCFQKKTALVPYKIASKFRFVFLNVAYSIKIYCGLIECDLVIKRLKIYETPQGTLVIISNSVVLLLQ